MAFSSALVLTDLNDYIAPSQACIKPVEIEKSEDQGPVSSNIHIDLPVHIYWRKRTVLVISLFLHII